MMNHRSWWRVGLFVVLLPTSACTSHIDPGESPTAGTTPTRSTRSVSSLGPMASRASTWAEKMQVSVARCLEEAGWQVTLNNDFSFSGDVPEDQQSAYMEDSTRCQAEYTDEFPAPVIDEAFARKQYADNIKSADCLEKHGYPQRREPISEQAFVDELLGEGFTSWRAYEVVPDDPEIFAEMERLCPQPGSM